MFKGLLLYTGFIALAVVALAIGARVPLDVALGMFAIGVTGVLSVAIPVLVVRLKPKRKPRIDWTHPAPRQRLPAPSQHPQLEAPQQRMIEAPRREVEVSK